MVTPTAPRDEATEHMCRILDELAGSVESGPIALTPDYVRAIERVEQLACNRPGADKTWVERVLRDAEAYFARARRA